MKNKIINFFAKNQIVVSGSIVGIIIVSGGTFYYKDSLRQTASVISASCLLPGETDPKLAEKAALESDLATASSTKLSLAYELAKAKLDYASTSLAIPKVEKVIVSDYSILLEKKKADDLYLRYMEEKTINDMNLSISGYNTMKLARTAQLADRKTLDSLILAKDTAYKAMLAALKARDAANPKLTTYAGIVLKYTNATNVYQAAAKKSDTYQYDYNQRNPGSYNKTLAQISSDITSANQQIPILTSRYNNALATYKLKYKTSPANPLVTEKSYKEQKAKYDALLLKNENTKTYLTFLRTSGLSLREQANTDLPEKIAAIDKNIQTLKYNIAALDTAIKNTPICPATESNCDNIAGAQSPIDDDRDGKANCEDSDCATSASCNYVVPVEEYEDVPTTGYIEPNCILTNKYDEFGNVILVHNTCDDALVVGVDEEGEGGGGGSDGGGGGGEGGEEEEKKPEGGGAAEICDNKKDDDGDGYIDCVDIDCGNDSSCQTGDSNKDVCSSTDSSGVSLIDNKTKCSCAKEEKPVATKSCNVCLYGTGDPHIDFKAECDRYFMQGSLGDVNKSAAISSSVDWSAVPALCGSSDVKKISIYISDHSCSRYQGFMFSNALDLVSKYYGKGLESISVINGGCATFNNPTAGPATSADSLLEFLKSSKLLVSVSLTANQLVSLSQGPALDVRGLKASDADSFYTFNVSTSCVVNDNKEDEMKGSVSPVPAPCHAAGSICVYNQIEGQTNTILCKRGTKTVSMACDNANGFIISEGINLGEWKESLSLPVGN